MEINKRKICDALTEEFAGALHYQDNMEKLSGDYDEVLNLISGATERYRNDVMFRNRVVSLVASAMQIFDKHATPA